SPKHAHNRANRRVLDDRECKSRSSESEVGSRNCSGFWRVASGAWLLYGIMLPHCERQESAMKEWFRRQPKHFTPAARENGQQIPDNMWVKCSSYGELIYAKQLNDN